MATEKPTAEKEERCIGRLEIRPCGTAAHDWMNTEEREEVAQPAQVERR